MSIRSTAPHALEVSDSSSSGSIPNFLSIALINFLAKFGELSISQVPFPNHQTATHHNTSLGFVNKK